MYYSATAVAAAAEVYWCTMSTVSELECKSSERAHHGEGQGSWGGGGTL